MCFILDGLDEYQPLNKENSVILKLLDRKCLPHSMIVAFSRPLSDPLVKKQHISKQIEVFGFSKKHISEYIDNFPFDEEGDTRAQLKEYLRSHPNIHDMCYLPIHAAMICFLFQFAENITSTQTELYEAFIRSSIHSHLADHEGCMPLNSLKDLDKPYSETYKNLCHLAYDMTVKCRQVISSQELQARLGGGGSNEEKTGLGLLTICPTLYQMGTHQSYAFLHLTIQEFLTAYYIANYLDQSQQMGVLKQYPDMKGVWLFYSGLIDFGTAPERLNLLSKRFSNLEVCCYAFESRQKSVCDKIIERNSGELVFSGTLSATDLLSIGYVVSTTSLPITKVEIKDCDYKDDRIIILLSHIVTANLGDL